MIKKIIYLDKETKQIVLKDAKSKKIKVYEIYKI